jgi:hypothetical protein
VRGTDLREKIEGLLAIAQIRAERERRFGECKTTRLKAAANPFA